MVRSITFVTLIVSRPCHVVFEVLVDLTGLLVWFLQRLRLRPAF